MTELKQALRRITANHDEVYSLVCKVIEVDEGKRVVSVEPLNGDAVLYDIRLQAEESASVGIVAIPTKGSWVLVNFLSKETGYVAKCSQVDKIIWTVEGQELEFTKSGMKLMSEQAKFTEEVEKLLVTLGALIDTLMQFQLSTNMGPTIAVMPQVIQALTQHKTDFEGVKTNLKTMLY